MNGKSSLLSVPHNLLNGVENTLLFAVVALCLAGVGCNTPPSGSLTADHCLEGLRIASHSIVDVTQRESTSNTLRTLADSFFSKNTSYSRDNKSGLNICIGEITIGGSNDYNSKQVLDILSKLHEVRNHVLTEDELYVLSMRVPDSNALAAYEKCIDLAAGLPGRFNLRESSKSTDATLIVEATVPKGRAIVKAITIRGGELEGGELPRVHKIKDGDKFYIRRSGNQELFFALRTDSGDECILKAAVTPTPPPQQPQPVLNKQRTEELAILGKIHHVVWAGKELGRGAIKGKYSLDDASSDYNFRNTPHFCGFKTFYGGDPARPHNIAFLVRMPDGSITDSGPLLPGEGLNWANTEKRAAKTVMIDNKDLVFNGIIDHYQGGDFDGWDFQATGGISYSARLRGSQLTGGQNAGRMRVDDMINGLHYPMPELPPDYEWELTSILVDGGRWLNGAEFSFRVIFKDRNRKLAPEYLSGEK